MTFNWKTWVAGGLLGICLLMIPAVLTADEGAGPGTETLTPFGMRSPDCPRAELAAPDGSPMPAPEAVRHWVYRDADDEPYCLDLDAGVWTTVLSETFTTGVNTSYVELDYNGQFNVASGLLEPYHGIIFRAKLIQNGSTQYFPGAGEGFGPFIMRRDEDFNGQFAFSCFNGTLYVDPDTEINLVIELRASEVGCTACFQNIIERND